MLRFYTPEQPPSIWGGVTQPVITYSGKGGGREGGREGREGGRGGRERGRGEISESDHLVSGEEWHRL